MPCVERIDRKEVALGLTADLWNSLFQQAESEKTQILLLAILQNLGVALDAGLTPEEFHKFMQEKILKPIQETET